MQFVQAKILDPTYTRRISDRNANIPRRSEGLLWGASGLGMSWEGPAADTTSVYHVFRARAAYIGRISAYTPGAYGAQ